jgi:hypothetical protein
MVLITIGFAGMAVGLAVALPIYLRQRWPQAFLGRIGDVARDVRAYASPLVVGAGLLGLLWLYWALGGTLGIDPAHRDQLDLNGRMLNASAGLWALIGLTSAWVLARRRLERLRLWIPMSLAFGASGSLFAWSAWKLPMALLHPGGFVAVEFTAVAVVEHVLAIAVGLALMGLVLRTARRAYA